MKPMYVPQSYFNDPENIREGYNMNMNGVYGEYEELFSKLEEFIELVRPLVQLERSSTGELEVMYSELYISLVTDMFDSIYHMSPNVHFIFVRMLTQKQCPVQYRKFPWFEQYVSEMRKVAIAIRTFQP